MPPLADAIRERYGLVLGEQRSVGPLLQQEMNLSSQVVALLESLAPEFWLAVRMDDFGAQVQLSFFALCRSSSPLAAPLRTRKKTCPGLGYLRDAKFEVSGGTPVAHCTVLLRNSRRRDVVLSFLEKDRSRRVRALSLGRFLLGVAMRALEPFSVADTVMYCEAEDDGSGRLVEYYKTLGIQVDASKEHRRNKGSTAMCGDMHAILRCCEEADYCRTQSALLRYLGKSLPPATDTTSSVGQTIVDAATPSSASAASELKEQARRPVPTPLRAEEIVSWERPVKARRLEKQDDDCAGFARSFSADSTEASTCSGGASDASGGGGGGSCTGSPTFDSDVETVEENEDAARDDIVTAKTTCLHATGDLLWRQDAMPLPQAIPVL